MTAPRCGDCRYFARTLDAPSGECRRYAPRPGEQPTVFPGVSIDDWCGEYAPKGEAAIAPVLEALADPMREVADYLKDRIALCGHGTISITCGPCTAQWVQR